jgi:cytochrome c
MDENRFNTIAGWTLFSGVVALGLASVSSHYFRAGKNDRPEKMGYEIEGVVQEGEGGAAAVPLEVLLASADVAKGETSFKKCASCHTNTQGGANGIGPNMWNTMGKPLAGHAGFAYSDALKTKGGSWDWATMDAWLKNPKAFAPGTKMSFAGIGDAQERANLLVYLNSLGSNLPLPAAPAAPAADAAAAPAEGEAAAAPAEGAAAAPAAAEPAKK